MVEECYVIKHIIHIRHIGHVPIIERLVKGSCKTKHKYSKKALCCAADIPSIADRLSTPRRSLRDPPQIVRLFESSFKRFLDKALREDFRWRRERRRCERRGMSCLRLEIFLAIDFFFSLITWRFAI